MDREERKNNMKQTVYLVVEHAYLSTINRGYADLIKCSIGDNDDLATLIRRHYTHGVKRVDAYRSKRRAKKHARIVDRYYIMLREAKRAKKTGSA